MHGTGRHGAKTDLNKLNPTLQRVRERIGGFREEGRVIVGRARMGRDSGGNPVCEEKAVVRAANWEGGRGETL